MATVFDLIVAGEIPCHKIWEDEDHLAFLDINPRVEGHTLVVPKHPWFEVFAMDEDAYDALWSAARKGGPPSSRRRPAANGWWSWFSATRWSTSTSTSCPPTTCTIFRFLRSIRGAREACGDRRKTRGLTPSLQSDRMFPRRSGGMADAEDSKSSARKGVRVRIPPPAPLQFRSVARPQT